MPIDNVRALSDDVLNALLRELCEESERRQREAKEKDWLAVRDAITNFTTKWGCITVSDGYDTITIDAYADMGTINDISMES